MTFSKNTVKLWIACVLALAPLIACAQMQQDSTYRDISFTTFLEDSLKVETYLYVNQEKIPTHYSSKLKTPVCSDSLCHLVVIHLQWDLLGNFLDYEVPVDHPLTKFDHEPFTPEDHDKLKSILGNKESPLRDYQKYDLIDQEKTLKSDSTDAITSATNVSIKEDIIEGALYTTHTLWHIVNGTIAKEILKRSEWYNNETTLLRMIRNGSYQEQFHALQQLKPDTLSDAQLLELIVNGKEYVPLFALQKVNDRQWNKEEFQLKIVKALPRLPFLVQNEIISKLATITIQQATRKELVLIDKLLTIHQQQRIQKLVNP